MVDPSKAADAGALGILDARRSKPIEGGSSFSLGHRLFRLVWNLSWLMLAAWTPAPLHGWRRLVLRMFGARMGKGCGVYGSARIWDPRNLEMGPYSFIGRRVICYSMARIRFEAYALASQGAHLCAGSHDISDPDFQLIARPIVIGERAWIAADAFVGPGVTVGKGAVLGARGVAFSDLPPWTVSVGNPARVVKTRRIRGVAADAET
jgi:putative colanic acid biosynthesis acetyltransferase WcaF